MRSPHLSNSLGDAVAAGHNLAFDIAILRSNISRYGSISLPLSLTPLAEKLDTLELSRQIYPKLKSHRLGDMVEKLGLDGINSHNAIDDAHATALLLLALAEKARDLKHKIELVRLNNKIRRCAQKFNTVYGEFYRKWRSKLHDTDDSADNTLCGAISSADKFFASHGFTTGIQKLDYVLALI